MSEEIMNLEAIEEEAAEEKVIKKRDASRS